MMTMEQRMAALEARMAQLEGRIASLEARGMVYGPIQQPYQPIPPNPWVHPIQPNPAIPPYTITCKMPDGTTREIKLDSPIVAQTNKFPE